MADTMSHHRVRSAALVSSLALILGAVAAVPIPAAAQAVQQSGIVGKITVQGNIRIDTETIVSYLPISVGDQVDAEKIDEALKALFRTGLFSDVKIQLRGTDLIVQVVENPVINRVLFEGNSSMKTDKLQDEVQVRPRSVFTRARVQEDVGRIVELYRREGRISATVTPQIVRLPQDRVDLIFKIDEGPKSGILGIDFIGNVRFSSNTLRRVIVTKESHWYRFFSSNDNYDPDRISYDREQLRKYYRNRGYYDFRMISSVAELSPDRNGFAVTYALDEGERYRFGKITVNTELRKLNPDILRAIVPIKEGQIYQDDKIEQATDALTFAAGAAGFAFVDVRPQYRANPAKHTVDVTFDVKEGPRVYIGRINIVGNTSTLDEVIRRQMVVREGDAYNRALVERSQKNIKALGFFKDVDITNVPGSAPDRTNLQVKVTEQPTGQLTFSAGYSTVDGLIGNVGITETNFRGRGQNVSLMLEAGYLQQEALFSFTEPHFLQRNLAGGFDIYTERYNYAQYSSYDTSSTGLNLRLGFPLSSTAFLTTRYTIRTDDVIVADSLCIPGQELVAISLCQQRGSFLTSQVGYSLRVSHLNDPINPTRGWEITLSQDVAGFGGSQHYLRNEVFGSWYHGFAKNLVLSFSGSAGYIDGWNGDSVRISNLFYKGGDTFRGFQIAGIGPRDTQYGDALGGKLYAIGTFELQLPTHLPEQYGIKAALFTDFGTLGLLDKSAKINEDTNQPLTAVKDDLGLRATAGISVMWKSPMGPLRFDFSQIIRKDSYDKTELFRFSTSTRF